MTALPLSITSSASDSFGEALPRFGGALLLLVVGLIGARILSIVVRRALRRIGLDELSERWGVQAVLARGGFPGSLSHTIGRILRIVVTLVVVFAALSLLGLSSLSESLNEVVLFLPRLIAAIALAVAGLVLAGLVRERIDRLAGQMDLRGPLGLVAQGTVLMVFGVLALGQVGVPTTVLIMTLAVGLGSAGLTLALAFGLGGRDVARQISAGRYLATDFRVGQHIIVGEIEGDVVSLSNGAAIVRNTAGATLRVPFHLLLQSVVDIGEPPADPAAGAPLPPPPAGV
jgi:small-conductance mechanosensitive channel